MARVSTQTRQPPYSYLMAWWSNIRNSEYTMSLIFCSSVDLGWMYARAISHSCKRNFIAIHAVHCYFTDIKKYNYTVAYCILHSYGWQETEGLGTYEWSLHSPATQTFATLSSDCLCCYYRGVSCLRGTTSLLPSGCLRVCSDGSAWHIPSGSL